ncbi:MAG TPA: hypothetical protein VGL91_20565 [Acidobacteriota bacterium]
MFLYDFLGLLFLILTGAFLLFLPLATAGVVVWAFAKVKWLIECRRASIRHV